MSMSRVLIVEDNVDNMVLAVDVLLSLGYEAIQAIDGAEALEKARSERPDVILMDLSLPRLDGWAVVGQLKADPELSNIPIIAVTAYALRGDRERALAAGCDDYVAKPIDLPELKSKLVKYLEQRRGH